jgi:hypothetical protein
MADARHIRSLAFPASLVAALIALLVILAGCGGDDDEDSGDTSQPVKPGVYVGRFGDGSSIALVTDGGRLSGAYLCKSSKTSSWIEPAPLADGAANLVARRGEDLGEATFSGTGASGEITAGSLSFTAELAEGYAGLYRTAGGKAGQTGFTETGWIVLPDGGVCGTTSTLTQSGPETTPAPNKPEGNGRVTNYADPFQF